MFQLAGNKAHEYSTPDFYADGKQREHEDIETHKLSKVCEYCKEKTKQTTCPTGKNSLDYWWLSFQTEARGNFGWRTRKNCKNSRGHRAKRIQIILQVTSGLVSRIPRRKLRFLNGSPLTIRNYCIAPAKQQKLWALIGLGYMPGKYL